MRIPLLVQMLSIAMTGCGSGTANLAASASVEGKERGAAGSVSDAGGAGTSRVGGEAPPNGSSPEGPPATPAHEPQLVSRVLSESASETDERYRLGLRLAVVEQGPNEPWLLGVVNRGTATLRVLFDLRTLSLEVAPPPPDETARGRAAKPPKPDLCALPKDVVPSRETDALELVLEPGEGVVDSFDPRLYCLPAQGRSPLVPGAVVTARLGFEEKTKTVWRKGKPRKEVLEQTAPFVARLAAMEEPRPAPLANEPPKDSGDGPAPLAFERYAVKQLVARGVELGKEYAEGESDGPRQPLALRLTRGSDARTEREATVTMTLVNESEKAQTVYFRRELVSFEIAGPNGLVGCNPGPDERSPERLAFSTLAPGRRLSLASRLIELCPPGAMRAPGLYLVHGRYETGEGGEQFGLQAFRGRIVSQKPALVRVRKGWGDMPGQRQPLRIRVGGPPPESPGKTE